MNQLKGLLLLTLVFLFLSVRGQDTMVLKSKSLKTDDSVLVYKPAVYNVKSKYPVVYLLHGHSANFRTWARLANLQRLADTYNFIVVCPDGLKKSWYMNSPQPDSVQYEDFFMKELMPKINSVYKTNKEKIFITGNSMGGFGAMYLFLKHPDVFLSAGSTSGVLNLRHSGFKKTTIAYLLGPYSEENKAFDEFSPVNRLESIKDLKKTLIFDCGTEDYLYGANNQFRKKCDELKIKATYIAQPGAHTGPYWSKSIEAHFSFFSGLANKG
ncbi:MAG: alpha/beta hydrolase family protein [Candidatus Pedobacter colombiensis]|uniref:Alpha/beta hydrolase family protein n=1 Tax=Candidatus Pedobacter colombiensis TaxID=3121371 RepID=A0AAJ5W3X9_9SPHI|nr:alpha/beta hydrolase family protein [Pedobacter sp.]WEK18068.1 MAG: alpha/beta hydrolase family protein [Pedobacter sp.]